MGWTKVVMFNKRAGWWDILPLYSMQILSEDCEKFYPSCYSCAHSCNTIVFSGSWKIRYLLHNLLIKGSNSNKSARTLRGAGSDLRMY